jgi:mycothiol synthase
MPADELPPDPSAVRWVSPATAATDAEMAALGLTKVRELYQMRRPLPLPADLVAATRAIETHPFRPGVDDEGFLAVNNRAFSWHPDQGGWGPEQLAARQAEPWFDVDGFLIHEVEGTIDGFCWTKVHPATAEDPALGEIYVIAADPSTRGTGLGRALTVAGLAHLAAAGLTVGMLYVESDNTPAVQLYERLGFSVHHADAAYGPAGVRDVAAP